MTAWPLCYQAPIISGQGATHSRINPRKILLGKCGLGRNDPTYWIQNNLTVSASEWPHLPLLSHVYTILASFLSSHPLLLWKIHFQYLSCLGLHTFVLLPFPLACFVFPTGGLWVGRLLVSYILSVSNPYLQLSSFKSLCLQLKSKHSFNHG